MCVCGGGRGTIQRFALGTQLQCGVDPPPPPFGSEWSFCILRLFSPSSSLPPPPKQVSHFLNRLIYCKPTATLLWLVARAHNLFAFPFPLPLFTLSSFLFRRFFADRCQSAANKENVYLPFLLPLFSTWLDRECTGSSFNRERFHGHSVRIAFFLKLPLVKSIWQMRRKLRRDFFIGLL